MELTPEEADRARRWAEAGPTWLRMQAIHQAVGLVTSASLLAALALDDRDLRGLLLPLLVVVVAPVLIWAVALPRSTRRFRAYAAAHPPPG